jgi:hypothetical protein
MRQDRHDVPVRGSLLPGIGLGRVVGLEGRCMLHRHATGSVRVLVVRLVHRGVEGGEFARLMEPSLSVSAVANMRSISPG